MASISTASSCKSDGSVVSGDQHAAPPHGRRAASIMTGKQSWMSAFGRLVAGFCARGRPFAASGMNVQIGLGSSHPQARWIRATLADCTQRQLCAEAEFAEFCKARLVVAHSLTDCCSAAFALPPFVHHAAFLKAEEPHSRTEPPFSLATISAAESVCVCHNYVAALQPQSPNRSLICIESASFDTDFSSPPGTTIEERTLRSLTLMAKPKPTGHAVKTRNRRYSLCSRITSPNPFEGGSLMLECPIHFKGR